MKLPRPEDLDSAEERRAAAWYAAMAAMGALISLPILRSIGRVPMGATWLDLAVALGTLGILITFKRLPGWIASALMVLCAGVVMRGVWVNTQNFAEAFQNFEPFLANRLVALATSILAVRAWVGFPIITATGVLPLLQYQLFSPAIRATFPQPEPWTNLIYASIALIIFLRRLRLLALRHQIRKTEIQLASAKQVGLAFLALRDLANSPMQSLALTSSLLRKRHPDARVLLDRMDRSVERLWDLREILTRYSASADWSRMSGSFDPRQVLHEVTGQKFPTA